METQGGWPRQIVASLSDLYLDIENPRHKPVETEPEVVARLCESEEVYNLAADIAAHGTNPLESVAVVPASEGDDPLRPPFVVVEGNRRVCALKLLADPDLAPSAQVERFRALKLKLPIDQVAVQLFRDRDSVRIWLERMHSGSFGGRGRLQWNAEQKTRFQGGGRHANAQALLDIAEREGYISESQRQGKLSVVDRWIANPIFREALGIELSKDGLRFTRPDSDRRQLLAEFMDLVKKGDVEGGISTRAKAIDMKVKARAILDGVREKTKAGQMVDTRIPAEPWAAPMEPAVEAPKVGGPPKKPQHRFLPHSSKIADALKSLGIQKLELLYHELSKVSLDHPQLLCVGLWTFYEVLTANMGRKPNTSFSDYMSASKLESLGIDKAQRGAMVRAFGNISNGGNITKHAPVGSVLTGAQLYNDVQTLMPATLLMITSIKS